MKRKELIKKTIISAALVLSASGVYASPGGDWKMHPTFGWLMTTKSGIQNDVVKVIDTENKTYMQVLGQASTENMSDGYQAFNGFYSFLYEYDKEADELLSLTKRNVLSENVVQHVAYNGDNGYLLTVYGNGNIDFLFDDGKTKNVPALVSASFTTGKGVNSVSFDNANNEVWLAADFGYIVLNGSKYEVAQSGVYNKAIKDITRAGDWVVMSEGNGVKVVSASNKRPQYIDFKTLAGAPTDGVTAIESLSGNRIAIVGTSGVTVGDVTESGFVNATKLSSENYTSMEQNRDGYLLMSSGKAAQLKRDGTIEEIAVQEDVKDVKSGSWDFREFWYGSNRDGLRSRRYSDGSWSVTRQSMMPNSPAVFRSNAMAYSPKYGVVVQDHGMRRILLGQSVTYPSHLSTYKSGEWNDVSIVRANPESEGALTHPSGLAIDPNNPDHVYSGSRFGGVTRMNISNPGNIVRFVSSNTGAVANAKDYVVLPVDRRGTTWPDFDTSGNLWFLYWNSIADVPKILGFSAEDVKNESFDASNVISININDAGMDFDSILLALKNSGNNGYLVISQGPYGAPLLIYNTNKTAKDLTDDTYFIMGNLVDQDGATVEIPHVHCLWEDPTTSLVWVLSDNGVFYFNPRQALANRSNRVTRVKVSRNDGTNLADYLLAGVTVYCMTSDSQGRKYFGTAGGGIVVTSSDGREILGQYTADNSYLASDVVYGLVYSPESRSVICSTSEGICEYFPSGSVSGDSKDELLIYPNPVRPDYYGWITIEGLQDGGIVKIVDAAGNLVKELGTANGGTILWDGTNMDMKRVRSGVYHVLSTPLESGGSVLKGKILVVN